MSSLLLLNEILLSEARKSVMETPHAAILVYHNKIIAKGYNTYRYSRIFGGRRKSCLLRGQ